VTTIATSTKQVVKHTMHAVSKYDIYWAMDKTLIIKRNRSQPLKLLSQWWKKG